MENIFILKYTGDKVAQAIENALKMNEQLELLGVELTNKINEVELIAKGRTQGFVFDTEAEMHEWLSDPSNTANIAFGSHFLIRETEVPDYWWDGESPQILETQKVDLTEYAKKANSLSGYGIIDAYTKEQAKEIFQDKLSEKQLNDISSISDKVDKVDGKGLSSNDYTSEDKEDVGKIKDKVDKTEHAILTKEVDINKNGCLNFAKYGERYRDTTIPFRIVYGEQKYYQNGWKYETGINTRCYVDFFQPRVGKFRLIPKSGYKLGLVETESDKQTVIRNVMWGASSGVSTGENYFTIRAARNDNAEIPVGEIPFELEYVDNLSISGQITIENLDFEHGNISAETGKIDNSTATNFLNFYRTGKLLRVIPGSALAINRKNGTLRLREYDIHGNYITGTNITSYGVFTLSENTVYIKLALETSEIPDVSISIESTDPYPVWVHNFDMGGNGGDDEDVLSFLYEVNVNQGLSINEDGSTDEQYSNTKYYSSGCLMLPPNYSNKGNPVPLIYFAHGSADYNRLTDTIFSSSYMDYLKYLRDEGYAVFDCYGWTSKYGIYGGQTASPTQIASVNQGIDWVCKNFNVDASRLYISAKSLGGISALAMCYLRNGVKPRACSLLAPCLDIYDLAFGYTAAQRTRLAIDFGFSEDVEGVLNSTTGNIDITDDTNTAFREYAAENAKKMIGYNPMWSGVIGLNVEEMINNRNEGRNTFASYLQTLSKVCNVPVKIFDAADDGFYTVSKACVQAIKNAGGLAEMRTFPSGTGGHHAVDNAENALKVESITTKCGVTYTNVPLAYVEMVHYFRRFE